MKKGNPIIQPESEMFNVKEEKVNMSFKVAGSLKKRYQTIRFNTNKTFTQILEESLDAYEKEINK